MPKLRVLSGREVLQILYKFGFQKFAPGMLKSLPNKVQKKCLRLLHNSKRKVTNYASGVEKVPSR